MPRKKVDTRARHVREREELVNIVARLREVDLGAFERKLAEIRGLAAEKVTAGPLRKRAAYTPAAKFWRRFLRDRLRLPLTAAEELPFP